MPKWKWKLIEYDYGYLLPSRICGKTESGLPVAQIVCDFPPPVMFYSGVCSSNATLRVCLVPHTFRLWIWATFSVCLNNRQKKTLRVNRNWILLNNVKILGPWNPETHKSTQETRPDQSGTRKRGKLSRQARKEKRLPVSTVAGKLTQAKVTDRQTCLSENLLKIGKRANFSHAKPETSSKIRIWEW